MRHPNVCFERVRVRVTRLVKIAKFCRFFLKKEYPFELFTELSEQSMATSCKCRKFRDTPNKFIWGDGVSYH